MALATTYYVAEPILEVTTRNVVNGQLPRHAVNALGPPRSHFDRPSQLPSRLPFTSATSQQAIGHVQVSTFACDEWHRHCFCIFTDSWSTESLINRVPDPATIKHGVATAKPSSSTTMMKVFVTGLPFRFSEVQLSNLFHEYGDVMTPQLWKTGGRAPICSGSVIIMRLDGERVIKKLNAKVYETRHLNVEEFNVGLQEERVSSSRGCVSPVTRLRRAKSLY